MSDSFPPTDVPSRAFDLARFELAQLNPSSDSPLKSIFQKACQLSADALEVERVGIWLLAEDRSSLRCVNLYERSKGRHSEGVTLRVEDFPTYFHALKGITAIPAVVAACDPITAELAEAYLKPLHITSMLDAPIFLGGQVVGVVCHEHVLNPREWSIEERDFASMIADMIALKLKAAELLEAQSTVRSLNRQLSEEQRQDSLGQLAAGVAHDFKNLLSVIISSAQMLRRKPGMPGGSDVLLDHIVEAAERGATMTEDLMHCGRANSRATKVVKVDDLIKRAIPLLRRVIGGQHTLEYISTSSQGQVFIEGASLERVLFNLVINARDAMPEGGCILLRHFGQSGELGDDPSPGFVGIEVIDEGTGIEPELLDKVFEPFFTTKGDGKGTGLGLAVVKQVVERAGGLVQVLSKPGQGTTFRIYLPRITGD